MTKPFVKLALITGLLIAGVSSPAAAQDGTSLLSKERLQFRVRAIGVLPDGGGSTTIGGNPDADNAYVPEFDISYFMTKNISTELILATSPHDLNLKGSALGDVNLGDTMILPPTLTLQYHFTPDKKFSPYVGAGINYTLPYNEKANGGTVKQLDAEGSFGYALQVGTDYWINENWGLNLDIKKVWVDVDASINNGAITGNVKLNPIIVGTGVSYRF